MKRILFILSVLTVTYSYSQEKKIWAKSFMNKKAPEIVVEKWLTDKPETQGKFILIDFWATWCVPCKKAIPELNVFQEKFIDSLVVIGISDETKAKVKKMKIPKIEYYSAIDTRKKLKEIYEVQGIPHCVIINPDGVVVWEGWPHLKGFELNEEVIRKLLNSY
ncbi:TlpA disulfide reductase family protein [uncultured Maribacter sp.]|uniref:TlpA family protein disulfide reductase n=1 Tax=uncultured Maribacter sp. TaxID=431308 RepID=UPI002617C66A|nr:TlpA disulfide reductase family protein [uncultured Maribacter sp.]